MQTQNMNTKARAQEWMKSTWSKHSSARSCQWRGYYGESVTNSLGLSADIAPVEGKVVDQNDEFWLLKLGRASEFFVLSKALCKQELEIGSTVKVSAWSRVDWDGHPFWMPRVSNEGGFQRSTMIIGKTTTELPIDKKSIKCEELKEMARVIEHEKADHLRTIAQVLLDAGAVNTPIVVKDVEEDGDIIANQPKLVFVVSSKKHQGTIAFIYDRGLDAFTVSLRDSQGVEVQKADCLFITPDGISEIGKTVISMIDDGEWINAKIEVLKPAKPVKAKKAAVA